MLDLLRFVDKMVLWINCYVLFVLWRGFVYLILINGLIKGLCFCFEFFFLMKLRIFVFFVDLVREVLESFFFSLLIVVVIFSFFE